VSAHGTLATRRPLWTIDDAARYLRVSTRTIRRRVADGTIPAIRLGGLVRFNPDALASVASDALPAREAALLDALVAELDAREVT
jgi:excisionase family DNA binding protein